MKWNHWTLIALGCWTLIAPWVLGFFDINLAVWNSVMVGTLLILFALWNFSSKQ